VTRLLASLGRICVLSGLVQTAAVMNAEAAAPAPSAADSKAAQAAFEQGRTLMARGRAGEACAHFQESERLQSGLGTQYHLADCYEAVGKTASAHSLFIEVSTRARQLGQKSREELARQRAEAVASKLVKLRIAAPHARRDEVTIERDGSEVASAQWGLAVPVDPGVHRVRAFGPGLVEWATDIKIAAEPGVVTVSVPPLMSDGGSSFWSPTRKVGVAALGVGVAGLGIGTAFAMRAHSKNEDSHRAGCSDDECPTKESLSLRQAALTAGNRATWALGVGASGVAAGTVLFFWSAGAEGAEREGMRVAPVAHARGGGLRVQGWF
jgi:hypothetical protein